LGLAVLAAQIHARVHVVDFDLYFLAAGVFNGCVARMIGTFLFLKAVRA